MAVELAENKSHLVVKRDGREESYSPSKMLSVLLWACEGNEDLAKSILNKIEIRIYNKISIDVLFDEVIDTAYNMISRLTPQYEPVVKRLYIQKMYKEVWAMDRANYPSYKVVLEKLISNNIIIDVLDILNEDEILRLDNAIDSKRDLDSTYLGLQLFFTKFSKKIDGKPIELLQHGFMRTAIQGFIHEDESVRIDLIIKRYNDLSTAVYTEATPKWINGLTHNAQQASCCLHAMDDTTESINKVVSDIGQYSKYGGGNAVDISNLRATGSGIGKSGKSSGPIPFIKKVEASISAFNQQGERPGACVATFQWWHPDVMQMLELKDEGGKESERARKLQYSIKLNRIFLDRVKKNESITLFDPKAARELLNLEGEVFNKLYLKLEKDNPKAEKINARDLMYLITKIRAETGNLYIFFDENVNEKSPFNEKITQSNLCCEIMLPTKAAKYSNSVLSHNLSSNSYGTTEEWSAGLLALCNLSSINIVRWMGMSTIEQSGSAYNLLRASDNLIDWQYYPVKDGEMFNRNYRAIGIGMNNLANWFAMNNIKFSSSEALIEMDKISKSIHDIFVEQSAVLAKERGNFPFYDKTTLTKPSRFSTLFSIAPTATSSQIIGATEGIEPVVNLLSEKTGTYSTKQMVPGITGYGSNYELAFDIPTRALYDLAAVRQKYIDQGQSINTYMKDVSSSYEIASDIIYAEEIGLKSLYYLQSKNSTVDKCDACGS